MAILDIAPAWRKAKPFTRAVIVYNLFLVFVNVVSLFKFIPAIAAISGLLTWTIAVAALVLSCWALLEMQRAMDKEKERMLLSGLEHRLNDISRSFFYFKNAFEERKDFAAGFDLDHEPTSREIYKSAHASLNELRYSVKLAREYLKEYQNLKSRKTKISCSVLKTLVTLFRSR